MNLYNFFSYPKDLQGYDDRYTHVPEAAWDHVRMSYTKSLSLSIPNNPDPKALATIANDPIFSYEYAELIKKPFPDGELAISKNVYLSYMYAKYVLHHRFKKAEQNIADAKGDNIIYRNKYANLFGLPLYDRDSWSERE